MGFAADGFRPCLYRKISDFCRRFHLAARRKPAGIVLPEKVCFRVLGQRWQTPAS
jgi:hypothetical protein